MAALKSSVSRAKDGMLLFQCPSCGRCHRCGLGPGTSGHHGGTASPDKPTIRGKRSCRQQMPAYTEGHQEAVREIRVGTAPGKDSDHRLSKTVHKCTVRQESETGNHRFLRFRPLLGGKSQAELVPEEKNTGEKAPCKPGRNLEMVSRTPPPQGGMAAPEAEIKDPGALCLLRGKR